jgi:hypothetical protein
MSNVNPILTQTEGYKVSERYRPIPTIEIIQEFQRFGFKLQEVKAAGVRSMDKALKQRHMARLSMEEKWFGGELAPQVVIYNSYDGTKALEIHVGFFRFVCANGLIAGTHDEVPMKIYHTNAQWQELVHEYIDTLGTRLEHKKEVFMEMKEKPMSLDHAYHVVEQKILNIRHSDERIEMDVVDPLELLVARRKEDRGDKYWNRYNVVQESLINGLFHKYDNDGGIRKAKVLTNIDEIVRVNKELSNIFEEELEVV